MVAKGVGVVVGDDGDDDDVGSFSSKKNVVLSVVGGWRREEWREGGWGGKREVRKSGKIVFSPRRCLLHYQFPYDAVFVIVEYEKEAKREKVKRVRKKEIKVAHTDTRGIESFLCCHLRGSSFFSLLSPPPLVPNSTSSFHPFPVISHFPFSFLRSFLFPLIYLTCFFSSLFFLFLLCFILVSFYSPRIVPSVFLNEPLLLLRALLYIANSCQRKKGSRVLNPPPPFPLSYRKREKEERKISLSHFPPTSIHTHTFILYSPFRGPFLTWKNPPGFLAKNDRNNRRGHHTTILSFHRYAPVANRQTYFHFLPYCLFFSHNEYLFSYFIDTETS